MRIMNGWTIDGWDVLIGCWLLAMLVLCGWLVGVLRQIVEIDIAAEECRDECYCPGSGHEPQEEPATCGRCGRYVEIGGE